MAEFGRHAPAFAQLGYNLAAISVDPPQRNSNLRAGLDLPFPLLSDPDRSQVKAWDLFNPRQRGGIAVPATFVLAPDGRIVWMAVENVAQRVSAAALLAYLQGRTGPPASRRYFPRWREWRRALGL